jgi:hypothetical protein
MFWVCRDYPTVDICGEGTALTPGQASLDLQDENKALMNNTIANKDKIFFVFIFVFTIVMYLR